MMDTKEAKEYVEKNGYRRKAVIIPSYESK